MRQDVLTILHIGLGAFHRAHQAVYLQNLHALGDTAWQLAGGNIRPDHADTMTSLLAHGGAYTLETISPEGEHRYQRIDAIKTVFPFEPDLAALIACGADPRTRIVAFTVTEAGYYLDHDDRLDFDAPDLASDLRVARGEAIGPPQGRTIFGALAAILRARMARGSGPLTLQCCDNLRHNGDRSRHALLQFITALDDAPLLAFAREQTVSPNSMVDRITPRPSPSVRSRVAAATGRDDAAAVMGESFIQWVIEDRFAAGRPDWARVGTELVSDVAPYEEAKIRVLNATHSGIAWAGTLLGYRFIHEGALDPVVRELSHAYVTHDVMPCLSGSPVDLSRYRDVVLQRFCNPAIEDTNQRVAMDGFSKIPGFIVPTLRECLAAGRSIEHVAVLPALFLAFLKRWHEGRLPYAYEDQAMDAERAHAVCAAADPIVTFGAEPALWGDMAGDARLTAALNSATRRLHALGIWHH